LTPEAIADANMGELRTLKLLGRKLSDNYSIFHSVHWSLEGRERTSFGEIDFVIVNRSGEILVIEQKDGPLEESDGELVKVYGDGRKSVNSQIQRNIGRLRKKFKKSHGSEQGLLIDYLIYCPQHRVVNVNAAGVDMSRTVDAREKSSLPERVTALLGSGAEAESTRGDLVKRFLAHSFQIAPDVSTYITGQDRVYTQLVEGLADTVDKLEFSPFRLRVVGTAGCGKSQLTLRFADRCLAEGKRTLLLCFNRPLADRLR
jgi:Holliday junction resolvase-like predicted endonuclease